MGARVRVSPVSRTAAILIIILGLFTLTTGLVADVEANTVAGFAFIVLGVFLYRMLYRFNRRVERELNAIG